MAIIDTGGFGELLKPACQKAWDDGRANLTAKGASTRNTPTTDTFALGGFTAAYRAISDACKKPAK